jgi:hypothetical protein
MVVFIVDEFLESFRNNIVEHDLAGNEALYSFKLA